MISLMITYRREPLIQFQPEWFYPFQKMVAFPSGVSGNNLMKSSILIKITCSLMLHTLLAILIFSVLRNRDHVFA